MYEDDGPLYLQGPWSALARKSSLCLTPPTIQVESNNAHSYGSSSSVVVMYVCMHVCTTKYL